MMYSALIASLLLSSVAAFAPRSARIVSSSLKMASIFPENPTDLTAGEVSPTGFFDPLNLSQGKDSRTLRQWRVAELKHGRVCMLASVGLLTQELLKNPIGIDGPAIKHLDLLDEKFPEFGELFILLCAFIEGYDIVTNWEPKGSENQGLYREDVDIGDLQWDPLEWYPEDPVEQDIIRTKELQNGRLAMLATAGIIAQELIDGKEILCHFSKECL